MSALKALFLLTHMHAFTEKCSIYDTSCLSSLMQNYATIIAPGGTGHGLESLDPMNLGPIKGDRGGLIYAFSDNEILGLKHVLIEKLQFNKEEKRINLNLRVPCLTIIGNYTTRGYLQPNLPFNGEGKMVFNLYNFENELTINYEIIKGKNAKDYIKFDNYLYWFDMGFQESFFENINQDDPLKATEVLEILKKEYRKLWQQYGRTLLDTFNDNLFETVKKFLLIQPVENILYDY